MIRCDEIRVPKTWIQDFVTPYQDSSGLLFEIPQMEAELRDRCDRPPLHVQSCCVLMNAYRDQSSEICLHSKSASVD